MGKIVYSVTISSLHNGVRIHNNTITKLHIIVQLNYYNNMLQLLCIQTPEDTTQDKNHR